MSRVKAGGTNASADTMTDPARDPRTALTRFGLGVGPGQIRDIAGDPRGYVAAQVRKRDAAAITAGLADTPSLLDLQRTYAEEKQSEREAPGGKNAGAADGKDPNPAQQTYADEIEARVHHAAATEAPFVERLVMFWSNVMTIAAGKSPIVRILSGAYEREAIRPHILGRFADLLRAATQHPAMLAYLDNERSVGPDSPVGRRRGLGLNENLARETLELHAIGVDGGYTQADVTNLARIITGWRTGRPAEGGDFGTFVFDPRAHEPGAFTVLGRTYGASGAAQGEAVLSDLAASPAAARYVARRLAAHFVSDTPPADLVAALEQRFRETDGDLAVVSATLATHDAAWRPAPAKFLPPYDFLVAVHRLLDQPPRLPVIRRVTTVLGQPTWDAPSPKGWPEEDLAWAAPSGVLARADWAAQMAGAAAGTRDINALAAEALGPAAAPATLQAIARAESRPQALALLVTSSEFQTR